jgi:hypothetical protein
VTDQRPVVLVLSDAKDSGPLSFRQRPISQVDLIDRTRREDVMIYGIGMRSRSRQPRPGLGAAFESVADELHRQYLRGFVAQT